MKSKIYTRTGDKGTTSLFSGTRVSKNNPFIEALGTIDEGNSTIGLALSFMPKDNRIEKIRQQLEIIQHALFDMGAAIATPQSSHQKQKLEKTRFSHEAIERLEKWIDEIDEGLPQLTTFILPGGHPVGATLHLARCIMRRAERSVIPLCEKEEVSLDILIYLNRLSDYLFVASRYFNFIMQIPEMQWEHYKAIS